MYPVDPKLWVSFGTNSDNKFVSTVVLFGDEIATNCVPELRTGADHQQNVYQNRRADPDSLTMSFIVL